MAKRADETVTNADADTVAQCATEYEALMADQARVGQRIATMLGRYEKQGVDPKAIKHCYRLSKHNPNERARLRAVCDEYAEILGLVTVEPDGQGSFADGIAPKTAPKLSDTAAAKLAAARAYNDGFNTGLHGGDIAGRERYATGSLEFVQWGQGFDDGKAEYLERHPDGSGQPTQATTSRKRARGGSKADAAIDEAAAGHA